MAWLSRLVNVFRGQRIADEIDEEMQFHLESRIRGYVDAGMSADDARREARRQFGGVVQSREAAHDANILPALATFFQDLRYAARGLRKDLGVTTTVVLSLALGIGANTAIFSMIDAVMLRSLPLEDPQSLVHIRLGNDSGDSVTNTPLWEAIRDHQQSFSGTLAYSSARFNLADSGEVMPAQGLWVSGEFFQVLGVPAILGRTFTRDNEQWGGGRDGAVAVISHQFWKSRFNGDPNIIGRTLRLDRRNIAVIGVTPEWFTGLDVDHGFDIAVPLGITPILMPERKQSDGAFMWRLRVLGRIASGASFEAASQRLQTTAPRIFEASLQPGDSSEKRADWLKSKLTLAPAGIGFSETRVKYRRALFVLMAIVGLVLLIECTNVANLLLARGAARQKEFAIRMAIGAGRGRIVRQLMTESLLLAMLGTGAGLLVAIWGGRLLVHMLSTAGNPVTITIAPDVRLLTFSSAVGILTAILFGFVPALRSTRGGVNGVLKEHQRSGLAAGPRFRLGRSLLVFQIAVSVVLLAGAGLFIGTLRNLLTLDVGFNRHNVMLMSVDLPEGPPAQRQQAFREMLAGVRTVPGVDSAAYSLLTPITPAGWAQACYPEGFVPKTRRDNLVFLNRVSAGYFQTMRTPLLLGREFTDRDTLSAPRVILINESAARAFFGDANPLGRTIALDRSDRSGAKDPYEVIGVVKDAKYNRIDEKQRRIAYLAGEQDAEPDRELTFAILAAGKPEALVPGLRSVVSATAPDASLKFRSLDAQVADSLLQPRLVATLSSIFGALALVLVIVGLYGVTMYTVTRRRAEIGIRIAMGAQRGSVIWMVLRENLVLLASGIVIGAAASLAVGRLVESLLFGVRPSAPEPLVIAALTLGAATALAALIPARRAANLDPMVALREE